MIIVLSALPLTELARRRTRRTDGPLLLLALLLLLRCALDPWDITYYALPFVFALLAWEATFGRRVPLLSLTATAAAWVLLETLRQHAGMDAQAVAFTVVVVPAIAALTAGLYRPPALTAPTWRRGAPLPGHVAAARRR
jgi:hypothetical protein